MAEIFYIGVIPVKTNHPGDFYAHLKLIQRLVGVGEFSGSIDGYWGIVPKKYREML